MTSRAAVPRRRRVGPSSGIRVLDLHGLAAFSEHGVDELVQLLAECPDICSVNIGDIDKLSRRSWERISAALCEHTNSVGMVFMDKKSCPAAEAEVPAPLAITAPVRAPPHGEREEARCVHPRAHNVCACCGQATKPSAAPSRRTTGRKARSRCGVNW